MDGAGALDDRAVDQILGADTPHLSAGRADVYLRALSHHRLHHLPDRRVDRVRPCLLEALEPTDEGGHTVVSARLALDDDLQVLSRERLFEAGFFIPPAPAFAQWFDVTPDGTRFIAVRAAEDRLFTEEDSSGDYRMGVVVGFFEVIRRQMSN